MDMSPESEGSNLDTNTGPSGQAGMVDRTMSDPSKGINGADYDKWFSIGQSAPYFTGDIYVLTRRIGNVPVLWGQYVDMTQPAGRFALASARRRRLAGRQPDGVGRRPL